MSSCSRKENRLGTALVQHAYARSAFQVPTRTRGKAGIPRIPAPIYARCTDLLWKRKLQVLTSSHAFNGRRADNRCTAKGSRDLEIFSHVVVQRLSSCLFLGEVPIGNWISKGRTLEHGILSNMQNALTKCGVHCIHTTCVDILDIGLLTCCSVLG